jgi:hypothetical protein
LLLDSSLLQAIAYMEWFLVAHLVATLDAYTIREIQLTWMSGPIPGRVLMGVGVCVVVVVIAPVFCS